MPPRVPPIPDAYTQQTLSRRDTLCVSITGQTPAAMQVTSAQLLTGFPFQEFRLDSLADPAGGVLALTGFLRQHPSLLALATCRPLPSGGRFHGTPKQELDVLLGAAEAGFRLVDLSLESAEALGPTAVDQLRERGAAVLVSFHDFQHTPNLAGILDRVRPLHPDLAKIVTSAETLTDSLTVLRFLKGAAAGLPFPILALAMGEAGVPSRVLGPRAGGSFTFAAARQAEATAPGQLTAHTLAGLYRMRDLKPSTRLFGVAGDPIGSSLSPLMLNTAFRAAGIDAVYLPLKTSSPEELFHVARELPLDGFSVTMPLKQAILPLLDYVDPEAAKIGAVNTVHRTPDGKFRGYNSDAAGIVGPLRGRLDLRNTRILVLGAGGAARAAVFACIAAGAKLFICNRTYEKAEILARQTGAGAVGRSALAAQTFDVVINATPAGMQGNSLILPLEEHELNAHLVFDLVYNPIETPLLALARTKGIGTLPGVAMFVHQGARQFEIWTGTPAPRDAMQAAVLGALTQSCP